MAFYSKLGNFLKKDKENETTYLSVALTSDKIFASVWELLGENINFIGFSHKKFHNIDGLIHQAAAAIDDAAQKAKTDISQVVFGLSAYWLEDGKLTKETSNIIKDLSENLELDAQAFVPLASAVNHFFKVENSQNPSLILVGALGDFTEVHLLEDNKVKNSKIFKGEATFEKVAQLMRQLRTDEGKNLPSKVVFFGQDSESHLVREFEKNIPQDIFAQEPKVQSLEDEQIAQTVAFSQVSDILGHDPLPQNTSQVEEKTGPAKGEEKLAIATNTKEILLEETEDFGFVSGADILKKEEVLPEKPAETLQMPKSKEEYAIDIENVQPANQGYESPKQKLEEAQGKRRKSLLESFMTLSYLSKLTNAISSHGSFKKLAILTALLVVLATVAGFVASQTISTAQVVIKVNSKPYEDDFAVTVAQGASLDVTRSRISGEEITAWVSDSEQTGTTGSKKTGTNAKGEIKVLNWTTSKASFDSGTTIISKNGVKFSLDNQVEVASRSASLPGETNINVTALEFGTSGNVDAATDFTFQKYDELLYSAKSTNAFGGGDEKQATVVAKDDQAKLEKSLLERLSAKAKSSLREKLSGKDLTDDTINIKINKKTFDRNLDEEASAVKLDMEVEASALIYDEQNLKELLSQKAQQSQDANLEAKADNIDILDLQTKKNKDTLSLSGKYRANLVPKFTEDDLKTKIAGKNTKEARTIIKETPEVTDVDFKFFPNLIFFSQLPKNIEKITFKIEAIK